MDKRSLLHRLDCFHPHRDPNDSDQPELKEQLASDPEAQKLCTRIQQFDARLRDALHDAPVPKGLSDRILAALGRAAETEEGAEAPEQTPRQGASSPSRAVSASLAKEDRLLHRPSEEAYEHEPEAAVPSAQPVSTTPDEKPIAHTTGNKSARGNGLWRFWPAYAGALAASLLMAFFYWYSSPVEVTPEGALRWAIDYHLNEPKAQGYSVDGFPPPEEYPFSDFLVRGEALRWHRVTGLLGREGVAYQWDKATLYVLSLRGRAARVRMTAPFPQRPPDRPMTTTGGHAASAWQQAGLLYLLVVDGDRTQYQRLIRSRAGQLANGRRTPHGSRVRWSADRWPLEFSGKIACPGISRSCCAG